MDPNDSTTKTTTTTTTTTTTKTSTTQSHHHKHSTSHEPDGLNSLGQFNFPYGNPFSKPEYWNAWKILEPRSQFHLDLYQENPAKLREAIEKGWASAWGILRSSENAEASQASDSDEATTVRRVTSYLTTVLEADGNQLNPDERKAATTLVELWAPYMKNAVR